MSTITAEEKIRLALDWVATAEPIAIPVVLTRWRVLAKTDGSCPTMSTNGRVMNYNPEFVNKLSLPATKCIVLHEVGHVLSNHQHRRGQRNPKGWNIAADLALNDMLNAGYMKAYDHNGSRLHAELVTSPVSGGCFVGFGSFTDLPRKRSAEEYYDLLKAKNPPKPKGPEPQSMPSNGDDEGDDEGEGSKGLGEGIPTGGDEIDGEGDQEGRAPDYSDIDLDTDNLDDMLDEQTDGSGKSNDQDGDEQDTDEDKGTGTSKPGFNGDDFEDEGEGTSTPSGDGHDPFADLPDPTDTFGGGVEDAPIESSLREDESKIILETLLGSDTYGATGLGDILSAYKQELEGDPELAASINWRKELEKFLRTQHASGFKYDRPSRRHSHRSDVICPARRARSKTRGLFIVDTSGSMGDEDCQQAMTHLGKILAMFPQSSATMIHCDTSVRASREYRASDFPIREFGGWAGRGGTDLNPAFKWAKTRSSIYDWIVLVTDMEWAWYQAPDPGIPTLWINTRKGSIYGWNMFGGKVPFGKLVNFHAAQ